MKETGIIFSTALVPKILDGTKTVTRRLWGLKKINEFPDIWTDPFFDEETGYWNFWQIYISEVLSAKCPYGGVGDRLYVKEGWIIAAWTKGECIDIFYKVEGYMKELPWNDWCEKEWNDWCEKEWDKPNWGKWCSPLFMPKWASRIWLEIVSIRPERLQAITLEDALSEGMAPAEEYKKEPSPDDCKGIITSFANLWDSLNPNHPWSSNPWCWRIEFKLKRGGKCGHK